MALTDYKITNTDVSTKGVQSAPDQLTGTAAENKALFDRLIAEVVKEKLNDLIDELVTELSAKMAAPETEGTDGQYLKTDGAGGRSWGTPAGGGDMLQSEYDTDGDGRVDAADTALTAGLAAALSDPRTFTVKDYDQTNAGPGVSFDGSGNVVLRLPQIIKATLRGKADEAIRLAAARKIGLADFNGTEDITLFQMGAAELADGKVKPAQSSAAMAEYSSDHTLTADDAGKLLVITDEAVITVPADLFSVGTEIEILRDTGNKVTVTGDAGVTVNAPEVTGNNVTIPVRYGTAVLKKIGEDRWIVGGLVE